MKFAIPIVLLVLTAAASPPGDAFSADMATAMKRMHHGMMRPASGDPDHDFAEMMIVHHGQAVEMTAQLRCADGSADTVRAVRFPWPAWRNS